MGPSWNVTPWNVPQMTWVRAGERLPEEKRQHGQEWAMQRWINVLINVSGWTFPFEAWRGCAGGVAGAGGVGPAPFRGF